MNDNFKILGNLAKSRVSITMLSSTDFAVGGFYKSGTVHVDLSAGTLTARYGEVSEFGEDLLRSLVEINYSWWQRSKDRFDGWVNPDANWLPFFIEYGLVTKTEKTVVEYK